MAAYMFNEIGPWGMTDSCCFNKNVFSNAGKDFLSSRFVTGRTWEPIPHSCKTIELNILTRAPTCSAFWSHPGRRHVWCVAWLRNHFNSHWCVFFYIRRVRLHTRLPIRVCPRYENRKFDLIDRLKKVLFKHDVHNARSLYAHQQIVRSHLLHFLVRWNIEKNKRTIVQIAVQLPYKRHQNFSACITGC